MQQGSTNSSRNRQRTFTSCTECRRRKQRCNQAKDRPCNNCSRRYPPVVCEYESSSPPPSHDHIVDLQDTQQDTEYQDSAASSSYVQPSHTHTNINKYSTTSGSNHDYHIPQSGYYAATTTQSGDSHYHTHGSAAHVPSTTSYSVNGGYYQDQSSYGSADATYPGYYSSAEQQRGDWLPTSGDATAFVGLNQGEYYYIPEPGSGI